MDAKLQEEADLETAWDETISILDFRKSEVLCVIEDEVEWGSRSLLEKLSLNLQEEHIESVSRSIIKAVCDKTT